MDWKEIGNSIADIAPGLSGVLAATGVGLPAAGAVGAIGALAKAFGLGSDAKPEEIRAAIQADPESALKLALAEMDYKTEQAEQKLEKMRIEMAPYLEGLKTKTIPWVDALHKMGRQIANAYTAIFVFILLMYGHDIPPQAVALLGAGNVAYQLIKGKGNHTSS